MIKNPALDYIMGWFSNFASSLVILVIVASLFLWEEHKAKWMGPLGLSFGVSVLLCFIIKMIVRRARPFGLVQAIPILGLTDYSFPSSHSAAAFSVVPVLDKEYPPLKWFWIAFAAIVAISRVYLGVHYFSDIVFGSVLGFLVGIVFLRLEIKKRFVEAAVRLEKGIIRGK